MLNIKTKNRLLILIAITALSITTIVFIFKTLEDNVLYFYSPSEIGKSNEIILNDNMRIGGMVKKGSIEANQNEIRFIITDFKSEIIVSYRGQSLLFLQRAKLVAEGKLQDKKFLAKILAKHDENYMPPEIKKV